jgi:nucleotide-binding universal stress UspA family protein
MKKILVPTDFSENALKAALYAAEIAQRNGATIFFLNTVPLGAEKLDEPLPLRDKYAAIVLDELSDELEQFRSSVTSVYTTIKTEVRVMNGAIIESIVDFSTDNEIDFIVMGTKGASGIKEVLIGTVAAGTISKSGIPVLIVPREYEVEEPGAILFATHHFEEDTNLLDAITSIAKLFSATMHVVVFIDTDSTEPAEYLKNKHQLDHYLSFLTTTYPDLSFIGEIIDGKDFENEIELYHLKHETDILAIITHPKGFWDKIFHKSVTRKIAFHSTTPVLTVPYREKE